MNDTTEKLIEDLSDAELVVADTTKFKIRLGIGENAYASMRAKNLLQSLWEVGGAANAGAAAASSSAVYSTFFASGGISGLLAKIGFGTAIVATPPVWIVAAAIASGGAYYGAMRLLSGYSSSRVETIPKFINTPIDLLGATIFDIMSGLALKVAEFGGPVDDAERAAIIGYFDEVWGISPDYARRALPLVEQQIRGATLKEMVRALAEQQMDNPDCNPAAMQKAIRQFLEEIAHADGDFDEREELAIELVERELAAHLSTTAQLGRSAGKYAAQAAGVAQSGSAAIASGAKSALGGIRGALGGLFDRKRD
ncbi:TerB family tellurite resistance protein [Paracoccus mangrovi]|uniref:TerB family tellurite resistance protein n=1 Tax=Paracoccus mangrovi TaxID=1715645 RepID=A0ABV7R3I4_9RHOB